MSDWVKAVDLNRCPPGNHVGVTVQGHPIMIANLDGDLYALHDVCSHEDLPLSDGEMEGTDIECIYHGATFDVCSGKATGLPAVAPVKTYEVEVRDGEIFVKL